MDADFRQANRLRRIRQLTGSLAMKKLLLASMFSALASAAFAADVPAPVYKAPPPTVVLGSGFYASIDGSWQQVNLPDYALGFHVLTAPPTNDAGTLSLRQRLDGYVVHGTLGYFLPTPKTIFGANTRLEIGALYGHASGSASGTIVNAGPNSIATRQNLDGTGPNGGYVCNAGQVCTINGNSSAIYYNWQVNGKVAGDYRLGAVWVTPSLAVFGGNTRNNQTAAQVLGLSNVAGRSATYNANTSLRWDDVGARAGLDLTVDVNSWAAVGIGGWAGFASRRASLSGSDVVVDTLIGFLNGASTVSGLGANATPFLANAEAGLAFKPFPALIVRGFVGLNYDSRVPGIATPTFVPFTGARTPASISFGSQTSYYAGGGLTWAFGPTSNLPRIVALSR